MEIFGVSGEVLLALLIFGAWIVVMRFVLPRLGVST
jgi:hypothetical protein